jgi:hypothetical protein
MRGDGHRISAAAFVVVGDTGLDLTQVLKVLTAYTLRMTRYRYQI